MEARWGEREGIAGEKEEMRWDGRTEEIEMAVSGGGPWTSLGLVSTTLTKRTNLKKNSEFDEKLNKKEKKEKPEHKQQRHRSAVAELRKKPL